MVENIPETGGHYALVADTATRQAVAKHAGLRTLDRLEAVFDLFRDGDDVILTGQVRARVGQACVVTLEPIENDVSEQAHLVFAPLADADAEADDKAVRRKKKHQDPPEPIVNGAIDLGMVATEFLMLGLDPYPRKAGVEFAKAGILPDAKDKGANPFAALGALKKPGKVDLK